MCTSSCYELYNMYAWCVFVKLITRNELADNCIRIASLYTLGPELRGNLNYFMRNFILHVQKFMIGHVAAQHNQLNYITNAGTHMCTSSTEHVTWSIS